MILKLQLTREQFAGLTGFIASKDSEKKLLKDLLPEAGHPFFYGEETDNRFASILKATPAKDGKLDVSILIQEYFLAGNQDIRSSPRRYLEMFFESMDLFPMDKTPVVSRIIDGDAPPHRPSSMDFLNLGKGSRHLGMGKVLLEKRLDGKLYINNVEVIRRPLTSEMIKQETVADRSRLINATVLWALWKNPELIPTDWHHGPGWATYFRGTIFADNHFPSFTSLYIGGVSVNTLKACYHNGLIDGCNWGNDPQEAVLSE